MLQNSKLNKTLVKRFFWLKLHHDFFNRDEIRIIESQPNGKDYIIFYLKLMLKSINDNGKLLFKDTIPYTPEMLASITNTSIDTVRVAIDAFAKLGLITLLDDGALFMQEVQKLVGSETPDAERKRIARAKQNSPLKLPRADKKRTLSGQSAEKVTLENRDKSLDNKENTPLPPKVEDRVGAVWLQMAENLEFTFRDEEQSAISRWAEYQSSTQKSITVLQIETNLQSLFKLKTDGYDITSMISDTISAGYKWLLRPSPIYLLQNAAGKAIATNKQRSHRYNNPDYFVPENKADKLELRDYIERCYIRKYIDPRTKLPLTPEQKKLFKAHFDFAKSKRIGITDYIYQTEVLTGKCLLEQSINGLAASFIDVAA
ncbi:MAG TPA: phage replisome organizer N-terminal domain-containing protein [Burkholderiales bacterium]|nr:phage replisome organizer N-terminal domain-containing protein [Burkholderiales bacterium]